MSNRTAAYNSDDPHYELGVQDAMIKKLQRQLSSIKAVVDAQAGDDGLWFEAGTCAEAYLQQALRRLHEAVEEKSSVQCAIETLAKAG